MQSLVLGIRHPAVATRDVALYQPFRNALRSPRQIVGLQTLMWHLMRRRCQEQHQCAVSSYMLLCVVNTELNNAARERPCSHGSIPFLCHGVGKYHLQRTMAVRFTPRYVFWLLPLNSFLELTLLHPFLTFLCTLYFRHLTSRVL